MQKLSGELQKHKKFRNHLFQSISEIGEAAVFGQKGRPVMEAYTVVRFSPDTFNSKW